MADDLTCPICLEVFKTPLRLECDHTFCKSCLQLLPKKESKFTCPMCRMEIHLGKKGVKKLQRNLTMMRAIKRHKKGGSAESVFQSIFSPKRRSAPEAPSQTPHRPVSSPVTPQSEATPVEEKWQSLQDFLGTPDHQPSHNSPSLSAGAGNDTSQQKQTFEELMCFMMHDYKDEDIPALFDLVEQIVQSNNMTSNGDDGMRVGIDSQTSPNGASASVLSSSSPELGGMMQPILWNRQPQLSSTVKESSSSVATVMTSALSTSSETVLTSSHAASTTSSHAASTTSSHAASATSSHAATVTSSDMASARNVKDRPPFPLPRTSNSSSNRFKNRPSVSPPPPPTSLSLISKFTDINKLKIKLKAAPPPPSSSTTPSSISSTTSSLVENASRRPPPLPPRTKLISSSPSLSNHSTGLQMHSSSSSSTLTSCNQPVVPPKPTSSSPSSPPSSSSSSSTSPSLSTTSLRPIAKQRSKLSSRLPLPPPLPPNSLKPHPLPKKIPLPTPTKSKPLPPPTKSKPLLNCRTLNNDCHSGEGSEPLPVGSNEPFSLLGNLQSDRKPQDGDRLRKQYAESLLHEETKPHPLQDWHHLPLEDSHCDVEDCELFDSGDYDVCERGVFQELDRILGEEEHIYDKLIRNQLSDSTTQTDLQCSSNIECTQQDDQSTSDMNSVLPEPVIVDKIDSTQKEPHAAHVELRSQKEPQDLNDDTTSMDPQSTSIVEEDLLSELEPLNLHLDESMQEIQSSLDKQRQLMKQMT